MSKKSKSPTEGQSQEFKNFEEATKKILKVPKAVIDKRLAEKKSKLNSKPSN